MHGFFRSSSLAPAGLIIDHVDGYANGLDVIAQGGSRRC